MIWACSLVYAGWFYSVTTVLLLFSPLLRLLAPRLARGYARVWAQLVLGGLRLICGVRWRISGREHLPPGPAILASQHQSAFDTLIWVRELPGFTYVLKRELLRIPLFGAMLNAAGMIPVDRTGGGAAIRDLMRGGADAARHGRHIVIFPEGTRMPPGTVGKLHPGVAALAMHTGLPIVPVVTTSGRHWGRRGLLRIPGVIQIEILPPLPIGLPRAQLLDRLAATFTEAARSATPVENSVGKPLSAFAASVSSTS